MAEIFGRLGGWREDQISRLGPAIRRLIVTTLEQSILFPVVGRMESARVCAPEPYDKFAGILKDAESRHAGRVALITGASRGIGAAVAKRFAREGSHVVLVARTVGGLEEVDDAIRAAGGAATLVPLDLTEFDRIDGMGAALARRFGRIDVLVGNAGILGTLSPMGHIETQVWDRVIAVNLTANWRLIRSFHPLPRASASGRAIFVTSRAAVRPPPTPV